MANKLVEHQLTAIETFLKANLGAELATLQAAYADGITLTAPRTAAGKAAYSTNELLAIDQLPFIEILPDTSEAVEMGLEHDIMDHNIIIVAHTDGREGRADYCAKRTYRFAEAIWRLITANRTLTGLEIWVTSIDYKPIVTDGNVLKGEVWVHAIVKVEERI